MLPGTNEVGDQILDIAISPRLAVVLSLDRDSPIGGKSLQVVHRPSETGPFVESDDARASRCLTEKTGVQRACDTFEVPPVAGAPAGEASEVV